MGKTFIEETARTIQERFDVPDSTIRTWRSIGTIPDHFFYEDGRIGSLVSDEWVSKFFDIPYLNFKHFGFKYTNRTTNIKSGHSPITPQEMELVIANLKELIQLIETTADDCSSDNLQQILHDKRIRQSIFFGNRSTATYIRLGDIGERKLFKLKELIRAKLNELKEIYNPQSKIPQSKIPQSFAKVG